MPRGNKRPAKPRSVSVKPTVLLVEDDRFLAGMYVAKLSLEGFRVVLATDGVEGWQSARESKPDLILLDIVLPKMSGFELLERVRKHAGLAATPVILLTNLGQRDDVRRGLTLGADDYLIKAHFLPSEVIDKVKHYLKVRRARKRSPGRRAKL
jgi:DNA-binding response OmpR family regulator